MDITSIDLTSINMELHFNLAGEDNQSYFIYKLQPLRFPLYNRATKVHVEMCINAGIVEKL